MFTSKLKSELDIYDLSHCVNDERQCGVLFVTLTTILLRLTYCNNVARGFYDEQARSQRPGTAASPPNLCFASPQNHCPQKI